ncbi:MAG: GNAT family N-acetyltransferase [Anaerolineae bacterium]
MMSLASKRHAIRMLLDENNPADAMATYYAYYHEAERTSLIIHSEEDNPDKTVGYAAISRTGIDLFRPLITARLPIHDLDTSAHILKKALPSGAEAFIVCPLQYDHLIRAVYDVKADQKLELYTFPAGLPEPIINIFVTKDDSSDYPRYVINRSINGQRTTVSSAGVNWMTPKFAEIAVRTWSEYRRKGLAKSVVSALTRHLIETGRRPIYAVNETNYASIELAKLIGFRDSGYRQLMYEVRAR